MHTLTGRCAASAATLKKEHSAVVSVLMCIKSLFTPKE